MHPDWEVEVKRLNETKEVVSKQLAERTMDEKTLEKKMSSINKEMWEEVGVLSGISTFDSIATFVQEINLLKQNRQFSAENLRMISKLEQQLSTPYFARVDFQDQDGESEGYYIGNYGLYDSITGEFLIHDWRAPVSSLFYEYEPGKAKYACPAGTIEGEVQLKRQFRIEGGQLQLVLDSNISIQDDILQDILAGNTKGKMKTIVSTIQREQNSIIRYQGKRILAVQGPAGSGKTSIALHRVAYLLYRQRDKLKADHICLLTPNRIFADYIATVLPELGEEEIKSYTLTDFARNITGDSLTSYETYCERMERQLARSHRATDKELDNIRIKTSLSFSQVLRALVQTFEDTIELKEIVANGNVIIDKQELERLFYKDLKHMPVAKRFSRIRTRIMTRVVEYEEIRLAEIERELRDGREFVSSEEIEELKHELLAEELDEAKTAIKDMTTITAKSLYEKLFAQEIRCDFYGSKLSAEGCQWTLNYLKQNKLLYEDIIPVLYLEYLIGNIEPIRDIKHVIIDEAQDYSELAYHLFSILFSHCNMTMLGDVNQNTSPLNGIGNLQTAGQIIGGDDCEYISCHKSYRSTVEIMEFATKVLPNNTVPYGRNGKKPTIMPYKSLAKLGHDMSRHIEKMKEDGIEHIAIIGYDMDSCNIIYQALKKELDIEMITTEEDEVHSNIIVIPSYLAKGLEFDGVIIGVLSDHNYRIGEENLLYTVCTRALHQLDVFTMKSTELINKMKA